MGTLPHPNQQHIIYCLLFISILLLPLVNATAYTRQTTSGAWTDGLTAWTPSGTPGNNDSGKVTGSTFSINYNFFAAGGINASPDVLVQNKATLTTPGGSATTAKSVTIDDANFIISNDISTSDVQVNNGGNLYINKGTVTLKQVSVLTSSSSLNFDSSSGAISVTMTKASIASSVTISKCVNSISISSSGWGTNGNGFSGLNLVDGNGGCTVSLNMAASDTIGSAIQVNKANLQFPGVITLQAVATLNSGKLQSQGVTVTGSGSTLNIGGTSIIEYTGNAATPVPITLPGGALTVTSTSAVSIDLSSVTLTGVVTVNNAGSSVTFKGGSGDMVMGSSPWSFTDCLAVGIQKNWVITRQVTLSGGCHLTVSAGTTSINTGGGLQISSNTALITVSGGTLTISGGSVSGTSTVNHTEVTAGAINVSGNAFDVTGGALKISGGSLNIVATSDFGHTNVIQVGGIFNINNGMTVSFSNSIFTYAAGSITGAGTLDVKSSGLASGTVNFNEAISLSVALTMSSGTINFAAASGTTTVANSITTTGGIINISKSTTFSGTMSISGTTVTVSGGTTLVQTSSAASITNSIFTTTGGSVLTLSSAVSVVGSTFTTSSTGTVNVNAGMSISSSSNVTLSGAVTIQNSLVDVSSATLTVNGAPLGTVSSGIKVTTGNLRLKGVLNVATTPITATGSSIFIDSGATVAFSTNLQTTNGAVNISSLLIMGGSSSFIPDQTAINILSGGILRLTGTATIAPVGISTINIFSTGTLDIQSPLSLGANLPIAGTQCIVNVASTGSLTLTSSANFDLDGCNFTNDGSLNLQQPIIPMTVQNGIFTSTKAIALDSTDSIELGGTKVSNQAGMTLRNTSNLQFSLLPEAQLGGTIDLYDTSSINLNANAKVKIVSPSAITFHDNTTISIASGATLRFSGTTNFMDFSKIQVTSGYVEVVGGSTTFGGQTVLFISSGALRMGSGDLYFKGNSSLVFDSSATVARIIGTSGKIHLSENATLTTVDATVDPLDSSIFDLGEGVVVQQTGTMNYNSKILHFSGPSCVHYSISFPVYGLPSQPTYLYLSQSTYIIDNFGCVVMLLIDFSLFESQLAMNNNGYLLMLGTSWTSDVDSMVTFQGESIISIISSGLEIYSPFIIDLMSTGDIFFSSSIINFYSNVTLQRNSQVSFTDNNITTYGSFKAIGDSSLSVDGGFFKVSSGSLLLQAYASFSSLSEFTLLSGSSMAVDSNTSDVTFTSIGSLSFNGNVSVTAQGNLLITQSAPTFSSSNWNINAGKAKLTNAQATLSNSILSISGGGTLTLDSSALLTVGTASSSIQLSGNNSKINIVSGSNAEVAVDSGLVSLSGGAYIQIGSTGKLSIGSLSSGLTTTTSGKVIVSGGEFDVSKTSSFNCDGLVVSNGGTFTHDSPITFSCATQSGFLLSSGGVINSYAQINLMQNSSHVVDGATLNSHFAVVVTDNATLTLQNNGIIVLFVDNALQMDKHSKLNVIGNTLSIARAFSPKDFVQVSFSSSVSTFNDNFTFVSNSSLSMTNATFNINKYLIFTDSSTSSVSNSTIIIAPSASYIQQLSTNTSFTSNSLIDISGSFSVKDTSKLSLSSSKITSAASTTLDLLDQTQSSFLSSSMNLLGSFSTKGSASASFTSCTNISIFNVYVQNNATNSLLGTTMYANHILSISTSGKLNVMGGSSIQLPSTATLFTIDNSAQVVINGSSSIYTNAATFSMASSATISVSGSSSFLKVGGGSTTLDGGSKIVVGTQAYLYIENTATSFTLYNSSSLQFPNSNFNTQIPAITFYDSSSILFDGTQVAVINSTLDLWDSARILIQNNALISFNRAVNLHETSLLQLSNCALQIKNSVVTVYDNSKVLLQNAALTIDGGSLLFKGESVFYVNDTNSKIVVNQGILSFYDNSSIVTFSTQSILINGSLLFFGDVDIAWAKALLNIRGTLGISDSSSLTLTNSTVDLFGSLLADKSSSFLFSATNITFSDDQSVLSLDSSINYGTYVFNQFSRITISGGAASISGYSHAEFNHVTFDISGGELNVNESSVLHILNGTHLTILVTGSNSPSAKFSGDSKNYVSDSFYSQSGGILTVDGNALLDITNSPFELNLGSISIKTSGNFTFRNNAITIKAGSFVFDDNTSGNFINTLLTIDSSTSNINLGFYGHSTGSFQTSNITILQGSVECSSLSTSFDQVYTNITDGNFIFGISSVSSFSNSDIVIDRGTLKTKNSSIVELHNTPASITTASGGSIEMYDSTFLYCDHSPLAIDGGDVILMGGSQMVLQDTTSTVNIGGGNFRLENNSTLKTVIGTKISIIEGSFSAKDIVILTFSGVILEISDNLLLRNNASFTAIQNTITIQNGTLAVNESSIFSSSGSNISISVEGDFSVDNSAHCDLLSNSIVTITNGKFTFKGSSVITTSDSVNINSSIPVIAESTTTITVNGAPVTISYYGELLLSSQSYLHIVENSLILEDSATLQSQTAFVTIDGGSIIMKQNANFSIFAQSLVTVQQGNLDAYHYAKSTINNSTVTITKISDETGLVRLFNYSSILVTNTSTLELTGGNLMLYGFSTLENDVTSLVQLLGGDLILYDSSLFQGNPTSTLRILDGGNFYAFDSSKFDFNSSQIQIEGNLEMNDFSFLISLLSNFEISNSGNFVMNNNSLCSLSASSVSLIDGGNLVLNQESNLGLINSTTFSISNGGNAVFNDKSVVGAVSSMITVIDGGNVTFNSNSRLSAADYAFIQVNGGGNILFTSNSSSYLYNSSSLQVSAGNIVYMDASLSVLQRGSSLTIIQDGNIEYYNTSAFQITDHSRLFVTKGNIKLFGSGNNSASISSALIVNGGNIEFHDTTQTRFDTSFMNVSSGSIQLTDKSVITLYLSSAFIQGGNFNVNAESSLTSYSSMISVSAGSATFFGSSNNYFTNTSVEVSGGNLEIFNLAKWNMSSSSSVLVSGGDLLLYENSTIALDHSSFAVQIGNCKVYGASFFQMVHSQLTVSGGNLVYLDAPQFIANFSQILVTGGQVYYGNNSGIVYNNSTVTVHLNSLSERYLTVNDLMIVAGSTSLTAEEHSAFNLVLGNLVMIENSVTFVKQSSINLLGGSIFFRDFSKILFQEAFVYIETGSFIVNDNTQFDINSNSFIHVSGGNFEVLDNSSFHIINSAINVTLGSVIFNVNQTVNYELSSLNVDQRGNIEFQSITHLNFIYSNMSLSGEGEILFTDDVFASIHFSSITVDGGSFRTSGRSEINVTNSVYTIAGGDTFYSESSILNIINSSFYVSAGNVYYQDDSIVNIDGSQTYITGGNLITSGNSTLSLGNSSCVTIAQGDVSYTQTTIITLFNSCWKVTGGNVYFNDSTVFQMFVDSSLEIHSGNFYANDFANIYVDDATVSVTGGNLLGNDNTVMHFLNGKLVVSTGSVLMNDNSTTLVEKSSVVVSARGGNIIFSNNTLFALLQSTLSVQAGNIIIDDFSNFTVSDSSISVTGGRIKPSGKSISTFTSSDITVSVGGISFLDESDSSFQDCDVTISNGNIQFTDNSFTNFSVSTIKINGGSFEVQGASDSIFTSTSITLTSGNFVASSQASSKISSSELTISGSFYIRQNAKLIVEDSIITIDNGDFNALDDSSFSAFSCNISILRGDFIARNVGNPRKQYVTFSDTIVDIHSGSADSQTGNMELTGNLVVTLLHSNVTIDGSLSLTENALLYIHEASNFIIPTGVVTMDETSLVEISSDSALINHGTLFAPAAMTYPEGSEVSNFGYLETSHSFHVNCDNTAAGNPLKNSGSFAFTVPENYNGDKIVSCINNLEHSGLMTMQGSHVTFGAISTSPESTVTLLNSQIDLSLSDIYPSNGAFGGVGNVTGNFENSKTGSMMSSGDSEFLTRLHVTKDFKNSGTMYFSLNSRDLSDPNAITKITAGAGVQFQGGSACICLNPDVKFQTNDRFDLVVAESILEGKFSDVMFDCAKCKKRTRSLEQTCDPTADYSSRSFSVLFESCDGSSNGSNFLTSITPPYYVIIPVAVGIILLLIIIFGGALFIDERLRRRKSMKRALKKRQKRIDELRKSEGLTSSETGSGI